MHLASLCTLATVAASWFLRADGYFWPRVAALCCAGAAVYLIFAPIAILKKFGAVEPGGSYMDSTRVVEVGPFRIVRHPQYLGYVLLNTTFLLLSQHWLVAILGILSVACYYKHTLDEESMMVGRFGKAYREYASRVPRFNILLGIYRALR